MREDFGYFMRAHAVDLSRYLPAFLHNGIFGATLDALSTEHEKYRLKMIEFARQMFIDGATWSMPDWLDFVDLKTSGDLETDRAAVKAKLLGGDVMTVENTNRLINFFCKGRAEESSEPNVLNIILSENPASTAALEKALFELMPAHLLMKMKIRREISGDFFIGSVIRWRGRLRIKSEKPKMPPFVGQILRLRGKMKIGLLQEPPCVGMALHWKVKATIQPFNEKIPAAEAVRLHFQYASYEKVLTINNPRDDLTISDIEEVGLYAAQHGLLVSGIGEPLKRINQVDVINGDEVTEVKI